MPAKKVEKPAAKRGRPKKVDVKSVDLTPKVKVAAPVDPPMPEPKAEEPEVLRPAAEAFTEDITEPVDLPAEEFEADTISQEYYEEFGGAPEVPVIDARQERAKIEDYFRKRSELPYVAVEYVTIVLNGLARGKLVVQPLFDGKPVVTAIDWSPENEKQFKASSGGTRFVWNSYVQA